MEDVIFAISLIHCVGRELVEPTITSSNKNNYNNPGGEIYAIIGTGGINFHGLNGKSSFVASFFRNESK